MGGWRRYRNAFSPTPFGKQKSVVLNIKSVVKYVSIDLAFLTTWPVDHDTFPSSSKVLYPYLVVMTRRPLFWPGSRDPRFRIVTWLSWIQVSFVFYLVVLTLGHYLDLVVMTAGPFSWPGYLYLMCPLFWPIGLDPESIILTWLAWSRVHCPDLVVVTPVSGLLTWLSYPPGPLLWPVHCVPGKGERCTMFPPSHRYQLEYRWSCWYVMCIQCKPLVLPRPSHSTVV